MCKDYKGNCVMYLIAKILVIIGGVNWGIFGLGILMNKEWNIVHLIFSFSSTVEAIIYVLVGISAVIMIFGCKCKKCAVNTGTTPETKVEGNM